MIIFGIIVLSFKLVVFIVFTLSLLIDESLFVYIKELVFDFNNIEIFVLFVLLIFFKFLLSTDILVCNLIISFSFDSTSFLYFSSIDNILFFNSLILLFNFSFSFLYNFISFSYKNKFKYYNYIKKIIYINYCFMIFFFL